MEIFFNAIIIAFKMLSGYAIGTGMFYITSGKPEDAKKKSLGLKIFILLLSIVLGACCIIAMNDTLVDAISKSLFH